MTIITGFEQYTVDDKVAAFVADGDCVRCLLPADGFRTQHAGLYYTQHGICQACQDNDDNKLRVRAPK